VALIAAALSRDLLRTAPPHQRRKLLLGLLAHAPASAGAALARGPVAALLRDAPGGGGEELALALVQALAGATAACGGAPAGGDEGAEDPEGAGGGGGGASGRAACRAQLAEAAAAMLEHVAPGPRSLGALLAHLQVRAAHLQCASCCCRFATLDRCCPSNVPAEKKVFSCNRDRRLQWS
jgi:hypothetical protein